MKKSSIILGAILSVSFAAQTISLPAFADFQEHYDLAQQYLYQSQYSSSIDEFKKALRINYLDTSARIGLANAYLARGTYYANKSNDCRSAADDFRSAIFYFKYYPVDQQDVQNAYASVVSAQTSLGVCLKVIGYDQSPESHYNTADQLRTEGQFPASIYELEQLTSNPKYQKSAYAQIADMMKVLGNNEKAAEYYKKTIELDPHNGPIMLRYARLLDKLGQNDEAVTEYNSALAESDNDPEILYALERIYLKKLDENPNDPELNANLGAIKQKQKAYDDAMGYYVKAEQLESADSPTKVNTRLNIGTLFQAQKNYDKALDVYKSILVVYPDNLQANLYKAQCLEALNKTTESIDAYEKVLSLDPTNNDIREEILTIKRNSMSPDQLLSYAESNTQLDKSMVDIMYDYAVDFHKKNDYDNAIKFYRGVLKFNPNKTDAYTNIALCFAAKKDYKSAIDVLTDAQKRFPTNKLISDNLAQIKATSSSESVESAYDAYSKNDYQQSLALYSAINPPTSSSYLGMAASYQGLKDDNNALVYYKKALQLAPANSDIAYSIGALYASKSDWYNAKTYLQQAIKLNPNNKNASEALAQIKGATSQTQVQKGADLLSKANYPAALTTLNQAIIDDSKNSDAYYYRGMVYDAQSKRQLAIEDYKKAVIYNPSQDLANYLIAVDYDGLAQYKSALIYYKKFVGKYTTTDEYLKYAQTRVKELAKYGN